MIQRRHSRMEREFKTLQAMMTLYCHDHHGKMAELCPDCRELLDYAELRLDRCPFQEDKTTCANCRVHCYTPAMRERVKEMMRYSGPRMIYRHPVLALFHIVDGKRKGAASTKS